MACWSQNKPKSPSYAACETYTGDYWNWVTPFSRVSMNDRWCVLFINELLYTAGASTQCCHVSREERQINRNLRVLLGQTKSKTVKNRNSKSPSIWIRVLLHCTSCKAMPMMSLCDNNNAFGVQNDFSKSNMSQHDSYQTSNPPVCVDCISNQTEIVAENDHDPLGLDSFFRELRMPGNAN